jgi:hypothetical protein
MGPLPVSGVWAGQIAAVALARQDDRGERTQERVRRAETMRAVLFFDEDTACGHAIAGTRRLALGGWWGPASFLQPTLLELAEAELFGAGDIGLHLTLVEGGIEGVCYAWIRDGELEGYTRFVGG